MRSTVFAFLVVLEWQTRYIWVRGRLPSKAKAVKTWFDVTSGAHAQYGFCLSSGPRVTNEIYLGSGRLPSNAKVVKRDLTSLPVRMRSTGFAFLVVLEWQARYIWVRGRLPSKAKAVKTWFDVTSGAHAQYGFCLSSGPRVTNEIYLGSGRLPSNAKVVKTWFDVTSGAYAQYGFCLSSGLRVTNEIYICGRIKQIRHFIRSTPAWLFSTVRNDGGWELHTDVVDRVASRSDRPLTLRHKSPVPDPPDVSLECPPLGSVNRNGTRHHCPSRAVGVYELSVGQSCTYEILISRGLTNRVFCLF